MKNQNPIFEINKLSGPLNYSTWKFKIKNILLHEDIQDIVDHLTPIKIIDSNDDELNEGL